MRWGLGGQRRKWKGSGGTGERTIRTVKDGLQKGRGEEAARQALAHKAGSLYVTEGWKRAKEEM